MTMVSHFSRQNDVGLHALTVVLWENLVLIVVLVLESKALYWQVNCNVDYNSYLEGVCPSNPIHQTLAAPVSRHPGTADVAASETAVLAGQLTLQWTVWLRLLFLMSLILLPVSACEGHTKDEFERLIETAHHEGFKVLVSRAMLSTNENRSCAILVLLPCLAISSHTHHLKNAC